MDEPVSKEVIAELWPDPATRPSLAWECGRCHLIYTQHQMHAYECPERGTR